MLRSHRVNLAPGRQQAPQIVPNGRSDPDDSPHHARYYAVPCPFIRGSTGIDAAKPVIVDSLIFAALIFGAVLLDVLVRPRPGPDGGRRRRCGRSGAGLWLLLWQVAALFGLFLALLGNVPASAGLSLALLALLALISNAKHAMLGEPLLFSDLALVGAIFRHPQFYLSAIRLWQRMLVALVGIVLLIFVAWLFVGTLMPHLAGVAILCGALVVLWVSLRMSDGIAAVPDAYADVRAHGLLPVLLLYWRRWRDSGDPPPAVAQDRRSPVHPVDLLIVVQCESFADPAELFPGSGPALPGLSFARANAWQAGRLEVSGFGAYTMRTEYGVLFGRDEAALGFRRYDPFLTALGEASYSLAARLKAAGWRSLFVHPHDMRFYGRDRIMPAGGFDALIGEDHFAPPAPGTGRYVTDAAVADRIMALAGAAAGPTHIYAVTIENHGPWAPDGATGKADLVESYLRLVRNSDAMLQGLIDRVGKLRRPALLVFFGDHRPSIPGATAPGGDRHTPYVILRFDEAGSLMRGDDRHVDLTPAELHHAMLGAVLGEPA